MKKIIYIILGIVFVSIPVGAIIYSSVKSTSKYLVDINYNELKDKIDNDETFMVVFTQTGCSHCESYLPIVKETLNELKYTAYNLNMSKLSTKQKEDLSSLIPGIKETPTTVFITEGSEKTVMNRLTGISTKSIIKNKLESLNMIGE